MNIIKVYFYQNANLGVLVHVAVSLTMRTTGCDKVSETDSRFG